MAAHMACKFLRRWRTIFLKFPTPYRIFRRRSRYPSTNSLDQVRSSTESDCVTGGPLRIPETILTLLKCCFSNEKEPNSMAARGLDLSDGGRWSVRSGRHSVANGISGAIVILLVTPLIWA